MSSALTLKGVGKGFDGLKVLDNLDLTVGKGEFVSILGPSGSGKSTILNILTGRIRPDQGQIFVDGAPLAAGQFPFAFMPQHDALMAWRTVLDNATVGLEVRGIKRRDARAMVAPLIETFGLKGFEHHFPAQLSGGMRQRVALLRTAVQGRNTVLLDEPFGALDALTRIQMQRWLARMWTDFGWSVLLVTHDVREAVALSDRIVLLSARPARVVREIAIPLSRPRDRLPEAGAIEGEILDSLFKMET
ncbi:MAG: ABC transporter ATP-binding protein [Devosia sp.]|uniref:ABC transporter ATP-binding protein n=1 Tax=Devosia sp. TaxID=1871048 RepID=UPI0024C6DAFF|nr:ABC transporter ATP-binding protein [Devosia sp.]UYN99926.1 MAG: ABC transporter ATP-binding protein [Devosia sp.]